MKNKGVNWGDIFLIIVSSFVLGCNPDKDLPPLVYDVPERIEPYIERFKHEGKLRGKDINLDYLKVEFVEDIKFKDTTNVIGLCIRSRNGAHTIQLDTGSIWWYLGDLAIEEIVFHELGHCFLNRQHFDEVLTNGDFASIMRTSGSVLYAHNPDFQYKNSFKRDYYLDELFHGASEEPCWSSELPNPNLVVNSFTRRDFMGNGNSTPDKVISDGFGNTWLYSYDQLFKVNGINDFEPIELPSLEGDENSSWIDKAYKDDSGYVWLAINVLNDGKRLFKVTGDGSFELKFYDKDLSFSDKLYQLHIRDESHIYFNSFSSFGIMDLTTNSVDSFSNKDLGINIDNYFPAWITGNDDGMVYFSKGDQLFSFNQEMGLKKITNENSNKLSGRISQLTSNEYGGLYFMVGGELFHFIRESNSFEKLDRVASNLLNSNVYQLTFDEDGTLWAVTNHGIKKFDPVLKRFSGYCDFYFEADQEKLNRMSFDLDNNIWVRENHKLHRIEIEDN